MSPKQLIQDTFEQLKGQASHSGRAMKQVPVDLVKSLLGDPVKSDESDHGTSELGQVDPRQAQVHQQIARLRQLDETRRQQQLAAVRRQQNTLRQWENERKRREWQEQQQELASGKETEEKQKKVQVKQIERRERQETLAVKRAQTQVEARLGKF